MFIGYIGKSSELHEKSTNTPCWQKIPKQPHNWVRKNEGTDQTYMVCETCKMLPGGMGDLFVD